MKDYRGIAGIIAFVLLLLLFYLAIFLSTGCSLKYEQTIKEGEYLPVEMNDGKTIWIKVIQGEVEVEENIK